MCSHRPTRLVGWKPEYTALVRDNGRVWLQWENYLIGAGADLRNVSLEYEYPYSEMATRIRGLLYINNAPYALEDNGRALFEVTDYHPGLPVMTDGLPVDGIPWEINRIEDGFAYLAAREAYLKNYDY